jgi:hypothetical protein
MLDKITTVDRIEVLPESGHVQVRQRIAIVEDGVEISSTFHRYVLESGADLAGQPEEVASVARAAWGIE